MRDLTTAPARLLKVFYDVLGNRRRELCIHGVNLGVLLGVTDHADTVCVFRRESDTDSDSSRTSIPVKSDTPEGGSGDAG